MTEANTNPQAAPNQGPSFAIKAQYVRDLSLENPHAPDSLRMPDERPRIDIGVDLAARTLADDHYECIIKLSAKASVDKKTLFMVELAYGTLVHATGFTDAQIEPLLFVDVPFVVFPFARRVLADATRDAGFPPIMLEPMDFRALYQQRQMQATNIPA
jgi:preprotein translocase subunit SecB